MMHRKDVTPVKDIEFFKTHEQLPLFLEGMKISGLVKGATFGDFLKWFNGLSKREVSQLTIAFTSTQDLVKMVRVAGDDECYDHDYAIPVPVIAIRGLKGSDVSKYPKVPRDDS